MPSGTFSTDTSANYAGIVFVSSSEVPAITRDPLVLSVPLFLLGKIPYVFHSFQEYFCLLLSYRRQCPALRIHQRNHDPLHSLFPLLCEIYPLILAVVFLRPQNKQTFLRHIFQCGIHCLGRVEPIVADLPLGKRLFFPFPDTIQNPESRLRQITVFA